MVANGTIEEVLQELDFNNFHWIDPRDIVVAQWVRVKCMFGCNDYGHSACPPNVPSVEECRQFFSEYNSGIIIQLKTWAEKSHYPMDWSRAMTKQLIELERRIFVSGHPKAFLLNQNCCDVCKECHFSRLDCADKGKSRPSPEAFAVDVYQTLKKSGIELEVVSTKASEITRIAFLLVD